MSDPQDPEAGQPSSDRDRLDLLAGGAVAGIVAVAAVLVFLVAPALRTTREPAVAPSRPPPVADSATPGGEPAGTQLASYPVTVNGGSVPLDDAAPDQAQFVQPCSAGDICLDPDSWSFVPVGPQVRQYVLADHAPPTYQGCKSATVLAARVPIAVGQTFCVLKPGRAVGVAITSAPRAAGGAVAFTATVWADPPGSPVVAAPPPSGPAAGTQVGAYPVTVTVGSVLFGDGGILIDKDCESGDLCVDGDFGSLDPVGVAVRAYTPVDNAAPTYQGCKAATLATVRIPVRAGQTFCALRPGRVIGGTVTAAPPAAGGPIMFTVTIWAD
ncbi:hypothetical protein ACQP1P_34355 [Dactylosporangium sp. CA-052675]|uniref:hypothetical protein n=1 Tax=Dactylosporangium sp. CA-052675 TaxID=3239927 RepID=UPI003D8CBCFB